MSKFDRVRSSFKRAHNDLFDSTTYDAEFYNYTAGSYDPSTGGMTGQTRQSIGTTQVEIVPPGMDTTVDVDGTSFSWSTSIRLPESEVPGELVPLGEDSERPTEVEITGPEEDEVDVFQLHGYSFEKGSGMLMCRLVED